MNIFLIYVSIFSREQFYHPIIVESDREYDKEGVRTLAIKAVQAYSGCDYSEDDMAFVSDMDVVYNFSSIENISEDEADLIKRLSPVVTIYKDDEIPCSEYEVNSYFEDNPL